MKSNDDLYLGPVLRENRGRVGGLYDLYFEISLLLCKTWFKFTKLRVLLAETQNVFDD